MQIKKLLARTLGSCLVLGIASCRSGDVTAESAINTELESIVIDETAGVKLADHSAAIASVEAAEAFVRDHASELWGIVTSDTVKSEDGKSPVPFRINAIKRARLKARGSFEQMMTARLRDLLAAFKDGKTAGASPLDRYLLVEAKKVMAPAGRADGISDAEFRDILSARGIGTPKFADDCRALSLYFRIGFSEEKIFLAGNKVCLISIFSPAKFEFAKQLWAGSAASETEQPKLQKTKCSLKGLKDPQTMFGCSFATLDEKRMIVAFGQGGAKSSSKNSRSNAATKARLEALGALKNAYADAAVSAEMAKYLKQLPRPTIDFDAISAELEKRYTAMVLKGVKELASGEYRLKSGWIFSLKMYGWQPGSK